MGGRLERFIDRVKGKKDKDLTPLAASTIPARDLSPAKQNIGRVSLSEESLGTRLIFGQRIPISEVDQDELTRIIERGDIPLIAQTTLPWNGPDAEIYTPRTINISSNHGLSNFRARREAEELRLKEFVEGPVPHVPLTPRISAPRH